MISIAAISSILRRFRCKRDTLLFSEGHSKSVYLQKGLDAFVKVV